ncbi:Small nuclear ribonucleoprotein E, partial [Candida maltosa Xu316]
SVMSSETLDFKPLLIEWVEEEAIKATRSGSKMVDLYNKILAQLRQFPGLITDLKTLKSIKFIGEKTAEQLRKKIASYCKDRKIPMPRGFMEVVEKHVLDLEEFIPKSKTTANGTSRPTKRAKTTGGASKYVPKSRSGGFAILIALYLRDKHQNGMTREEITKYATPYCDRSFTNNAASKEFYSAWSSMKTVIKNDLVSETGRSPKMYFLTEEGKKLASQLKNTVGITSSPVSEKSNMDRSFDNGVRFESSFEFSSPVRLMSSSPIQKINNPAHTHRMIQQVLTDKSNQNQQAVQHDARNRKYDGTAYEIWRKEDYEIVVCIDNREVRSRDDRDHFSNRLRSAGVTCEVLPLSSGDIVWIARNLINGKKVVLNYLCERKRLDDLCDSIKDGRFQEQKNRMKKTGIKHCYYLIEEMTSVKDQIRDIMDSIQSSMTQTMTSARFYLRRFRDIDETTAFLASNTRAIESVKSDLIVIKPNDIRNQQDYLDILTKFRHKFEINKQGYECVHLLSSFQDMLGKTNQMTVKEMFILMLMTIRGVSLEKAIVIQSRFPTPKSLLEFFHTENGNAPEDFKKNLMMNEFKDQVGNKKIGKALSEKIYEVWGQ